MSDDNNTPSLLRRTLKITGTFLSTSMTAALAIGLVVIGSSFIADRAESVGLPDVAPPVAVRTQTLTLEPGYRVVRGFVGQLEAAQQADLAFEAGGTLAEIFVEEGDRVAKGAVLARTDTRALNADRDALTAARAALEAQLELAQLTLNRQEALEKQGFAATQRFDEARISVMELAARMDQTDAQIARVEVSLDKSELRAPFAGRIGARMADLGQTVGVGTPVLSLLEEAAPRLRVGLPADTALSLSDTHDAHDAEAIFGQMRFPARLVYLRPDLDPRTRTRSAVFELELAQGEPGPAFGQSGQIRLTQEIEDAGAWVPLTALREGVNGSWTVLSVNAENRAALEAVELLHSDETRAFVRGSFADGTALIAAGPHRVVPGQSVDVLE
ncbi:MAG: efflux RND transporter periplasmic adaptor subunit [Pseudomonadota bacterium]